MRAEAELVMRDLPAVVAGSRGAVRARWAECADADALQGVHIRAAFASRDPSDDRRKRLSRRLHGRSAVAGQNLRLATPAGPMGWKFGAVQVTRGSLIVL
jgi:hypothetical protein